MRETRALNWQDKNIFMSHFRRTHLESKTVNLKFQPRQQNPRNYPPSGWKHQRVLPKHFACKHCSKAFAKEKNSKKHESKHQDLNNRWCSVCDCNFRTLDELHKHIARNCKHEIYGYEQREHVSTALTCNGSVERVEDCKEILRWRIS